LATRRALQSANSFVQRLKVATDRTVETDFSITTVIGQRNINGVIVYIKTYNNGILVHDLPPWLWLCVVNTFYTQHNPCLQGAGRLFSADSHYV